MQLGNSRAPGARALGSTLPRQPQLDQHRQPSNRRKYRNAGKKMAAVGDQPGRPRKKDQTDQAVPGLFLKQCVEPVRTKDFPVSLG